MDAKNNMQRKANAIARKHGYGSATQIVHGTIDRVLSHRPYGFLTASGRFFPRITTTRYPWSGKYQRAETIVEIDIAANRHVSQC